MSEDVKLGISGSEETLPVVRWLEGDKPSFPRRPAKVIESFRVSDGSTRYGFFEKKYEWSLAWGYLTSTQKDALLALQDLNQQLRFQDNWEDSTWFNVIILDFNYEVMDSSMRNMNCYKAEMILVEV